MEWLKSVPAGNASTVRVRLRDGCVQKLLRLISRFDADHAFLLVRPEGLVFGVNSLITIEVVLFNLGTGAVAFGPMAAAEVQQWKNSFATSVADASSLDDLLRRQGRNSTPHHQAVAEPDAGFAFVPENFTPSEAMHNTGLWSHVNMETLKGLLRCVGKVCTECSLSISDSDIRAFGQATKDGGAFEVSMALLDLGVREETFNFALLFDIDYLRMTRFQVEIDGDWFETWASSARRKSKVKEANSTDRITLIASPGRLAINQEGDLTIATSCAVEGLTAEYGGTYPFSADRLKPWVEDVSAVFVGTEEGIVLCSGTTPPAPLLGCHMAQVLQIN